MSLVSEQTETVDGRQDEREAQAGYPLQGAAGAWAVAYLRPLKASTRVDPHEHSSWRAVHRSCTVCEQTRVRPGRLAVVAKGGQDGCGYGSGLLRGR